MSKAVLNMAMHLFTVMHYCLPYYPFPLVLVFEHSIRLCSVPDILDFPFVVV